MTISRPWIQPAERSFMADTLSHAPGAVADMDGKSSGRCGHILVIRGRILLMRE
jgi:hypothetical protein